jgi:ring-1,2-phenylacetyl-CoA epoxidase subunit PaaC
MNEAIKDLLFKMADDELIMGHRNSEWTGLGPIFEEDIAFSSMAQDKVGHALANYTILHEQFAEPAPDIIGFHRQQKEFKCCQLVELPIGEYDFSLIRHFLFDYAEVCRYEALAKSSFEPIARLAKKIKGELKYHTLHADTWLTKLGNATEESHARMQAALNEGFPFALGIFEEGDFENDLINEKIFIGEKALQQVWLERITPLIENSSLMIPENSKPQFGGRKGYHTEFLAPLLAEMTEVVRFDAEATEW